MRAIGDVRCPEGCRSQAKVIFERALSFFGLPFEPGLAAQLTARLLKPLAIEEHLQGALGPGLIQVIVAGALEERVVFLQRADSGWAAAHLADQPIGLTRWPHAIAQGIEFTHPERSISEAKLSPDAIFRLTRPRVTLVGLCHPEIFPFPRFPLAISDLARALRLRFHGRVVLYDMQLGQGLPEILTRIGADQPDIVGISATFGQYDLLESLAESLQEIAERALIVFGGSLSALNSSRLLERFPSALVANGPGEATLQDLVEVWHGGRAMPDVRGLQWCSGGLLMTSRGVANRDVSSFLPELDLLDETLDRHGVMQLESSRGCTHACSFCPREHKGIWAGQEALSLAGVLDAVGQVFESRPAVARKIFLVDEEFVGHDVDGEGLKRALQISSSLKTSGFRWETSSRVDQIYRPEKGSEWHAERIRFWSRLREDGLDRCLFGLESGVDSILKRFNKRITARQNAIALRLLSASGIPIRCTYITFDHLMTQSELLESCAFQGRRDLLLKPQPGMSAEVLFEAVQDEEFVSANAQGVPLYRSISYLLVSMECLLGSPYLRKVEAAGLAGEELPAMGRRNARFRDPAIGTMSDAAQRWVDRNFSLDYALKSLEKVLSDDERSLVRSARGVLKEFSYRLLGMFLAQDLRGLDGSPTSDEEQFRLVLRSTMDLHFEELVEALDGFGRAAGRSLPRANQAFFANELARWSGRSSWSLINA